MELYLIQYGGEWDVEHTYKNFCVDGVFLDTQCDFNGMSSEVNKVLKVDSTTTTIEIKYVVKENYPPIKIYDDRTLLMYTELRRKSSKFTDFPLCISVCDNSQGGTDSNPNTMQSNLNVIQDMPEIDNLETIELITTGSGEDSDYVIFAEDSIIDDNFHLDVSEEQLYKNKETLKNVMNNYAVRNDFQFKVIRSSTTRYYIACVDDQCDWSLKSSSLHTSKIFKVREFNDVHLVYTPRDIQRDMKRELGVDFNYMKAWRSREKALELLRCKPSDSYQKLPKYFYMLTQSNPGSVVNLVKSEDGRFLYGYVALYGSIKGWEYCRPVLLVDGSFLKSTHRGTILTACTQDAAGKIFPLAHAIVDSETNESWEWFFQNLRQTFGSREGLCIVSDRHESILRATKVVYPGVPHCVCIYHLWNNIKTNFKKRQKQLKDVFFAMAKAYTVAEFDQHMSEVNKIDNRVKDYLFDIGYHRWSLAHSSVKRYKVMTSNIAESMNASNKDARDLPIYDLLDYVMNNIVAS
ncbi:uncharacterized protein LOC132639559 [Lycium barbarum]|uniref:uncharacterized protein LOC132639559 n=1 Tax=Lycium barbarum TaxID=112863 RepID=UPI00293EA2AB|nr:uncharacterized protein LOC132639559 [Lycium barbarum]